MNYLDIIIIVASILVIAAICFFIVRSPLNSNRKNSKQVLNQHIGSMVKKQTGFMQQKEYNFYKLLQEAGRGMTMVTFPKISVAQIVSTTSEKIKNLSSINTVLDYVMFDAMDYSPIIVIDLYDNTIGDKSILEMDAYLVKIVLNSGIPILKVQYDGAMTTATLRKLIEDAISEYKKFAITKKDKV